MGDFEISSLGFMESSVEYHHCINVSLTYYHVSGSRTVLGGQFDWGGRLPKGNGGAQWYTQHGWKSCAERNGISVLDCETDRSNR